MLVAKVLLFRYHDEGWADALVSPVPSKENARPIAVKVLDEYPALHEGEVLRLAAREADIEHDINEFVHVGSDIWFLYS